MNAEMSSQVASECANEASSLLRTVRPAKSLQQNRRKTEMNECTLVASASAALSVRLWVI